MDSKLNKTLIKALGIFIFGLIVHFPACTFAFGANAQSVNEIEVSLNVGSSPTLRELLNSIEQSTGFKFSYLEYELKPSSHTVRIKRKYKSLGKMLSDVSRQIKLSFRRVNDKIYIRKKVREVGAVTEIIGKEEVNVKGRVVDETGQGLPGASVVEKGTTNGIITDADGNYKLTVPEGATLVFSFLGYVTQEIEIGNRTEIDVVLEPDATQLDEVVVVGYGAVKKSDLTGSVGSMKSEEIAKQPVARVDQALQGRISGVQVTSASGAPGEGTSIRIRGGNSINAGNEPLYVIDGFIGGGDLNTINPKDIESIEVLKDASSTSIYGSRGSNGVILITTKRGADSEGWGVSFDSYFGIQNKVKKLDLLNGPELAQFANEANEVLGTQLPFPNISEAANTDWQDAIFRDAPIFDTNLSFYNKTEKSNYFVSLNHFNQKGIQLGSSVKRYQLRFNFDHNIADIVKVGASLNTSYIDRENPRVEGLLVGILNTAPIYNDDGTFHRVDQLNGSTYNNPIAQNNLKSDENKSNRALGNIYMQLTPIKNLMVKSTFGFDFSTDRRNIYTSGRMPTRFEAAVGGAATINTNVIRSIQNENTVNYIKNINKHNFNVLGGWTYQDFYRENLNVSAAGFSNDVTRYNAIQTGDPSRLRANSSNVEWKLLSGFYRLNYSYDGKYLLTLSGRHDGSSRLAEGNKWQFFPSAAIAWNVGEESFLNNSSTISKLKLRASYGKTGSQSIAPYATLARLQSGINYIGGNQVVFNRPGIASSPTLTWEVTNQLDIGAELGLFKGRLNLEFDYYKKKTKDLLLERELAFQTGFPTRLENVGSLQNSGVELGINGYLIQKGDFSWSSTLSLSTNKNKVLKLSGGKEYIENGEGSRIIVGEPIGTFYGVKYIGLWQADDPDLGSHDPGEPKFEDLNNDGLIDINDGQIIGDSNPDFFGGMNHVFNYKNLSVSLFFDFSVGNDIYDLDGGYFNTGFASNVYGKFRDRWTPENTDTNIPRAGMSEILLFRTYASSVEGKGNDFFISDGSFLRLKNINIQYEVPLKKSIFRNLTVFGSATNVFTITGYDGYSPDVSAVDTGTTGGEPNISSPTRRGFDSNVYPQARVITIGLKADF